MCLCRRFVFLLAILSTINQPTFAQPPDAPGKADGLGYYLPMQILTLDTTTTVETRREARLRPNESEPCDSAAPAYPVTQPIAPPKPVSVQEPSKPSAAPASEPHVPHVSSPKGKLCIEETATTTRVVNAQLKLVPDVANGIYRLSVPGKALADVKLSVELRDGALLKSLNASSQGRAGDVIVGIAKFAATILSGGLTPMFAQQGTEPPKPTDCNPFWAPFKDQADNVRLLLSRNASACEAWVSIDTWNKHAQKLAADVKSSEEKLGGTNEPELTQLVNRLKEQRKAVEDARKVSTGLQSVVAAMLDNFIRAHGLGSKVEESRSVDALELHELPGDSIKIEDRITTWEQLQKMLEKHKAAADVLKRAGVAVRLLVPDSNINPGATYGTLTCSEARDDRLDVWFRSALPVRLQLFVAETPLDDGQAKLDPATNTPLQTMKLIAERIEPVTFQGLPPRCVTFKASSFANRELVVSFDERGQLARVDHTAGSSAAAAVTALASAATTFRDEYAATLAKVVDIQSNERKIKLDDLTTRVETLKKERERLDAQLSTEAAAANFDLSLQQQRLAAEAAQLQAESALETAQSTAEQRLLIEQLKVELDLVKRELELLKAKQELTAAKGS